MHDWLKSWPALALACGLPLNKEGRPLIVSPSQHCKRRHVAGAPVHESLFVLVVLQALHRRLIGARDLIIDSAPILVLSDGVTQMPPTDTLPLTILFLCCEASAYTPSSVVVEDFLSCFCFLLPTHTMPPLHNPCWHGLSSSTTSILGSFAWTPPIGAYASLLGFIACLALSPSWPTIPRTARTALAYLLPGPEKNSADAAPLNAFLGAFFSFFICNVLP